MNTISRFEQRLQARFNDAQTGFTLIELMVTIAIATTLMMVAVPSYVQFQRNAQLSDAVSSFVSAANTARTNAMRQGVNTYLVSATGTNWGSGWFVYSDANWNKIFDVDTEEVILRRQALSTDLTIITPGAAGGPNSLVDGYFIFNGSGYPRLKNGSFSNGRMEIKTTDRTRTIFFDQIGRVRSCVTGSAGCLPIP